LDGKQDLAVAVYGSSRLSTLLGNGDGSFQTATVYSNASNPMGVVVGDFNEDGRPDVATGNAGDSTATVLFGNKVKPLSEDPAGSGLRSGFGRGNLSVYNTDADYWSFSANAGDQIVIAAETPGNPSNSSLAYNLFKADGSQVTGFTSNFSGQLNSSAITIPSSGTYFVRVTNNNAYEGEYRLRVSKVTPPVQIENEANDTTSNATPVTFTVNGSNKTATVAGNALATSDLDYFNLGTVNAGQT